MAKLINYEVIKGTFEGKDFTTYKIVCVENAHNYTDKYNNEHIFPTNKKVVEYKIKEKDFTPNIKDLLVDVTKEFEVLKDSWNNVKEIKFKERGKE